MKFLIMFALILAFSATGFSQTKKIAHRSHSGSDATFSIQTPGNFGETPEMEAARKKREADKLKADSIAKRAIADSMSKIKMLDKNKNKNKSKNKEKNETTFTVDTTKKQR